MTRYLRTMGIIPAVALTFAACDSDTTAPAAPETIVDVALSVNETSGEFSTLIAALVSADLVDALAGPGPFTVFAPTDAAFAEIGLDASNIGSLPAEALADILLYHVVPERRDAASVTAVSSLTMANGGTTTIAVSQSGAFINDARIVQTDVAASNGIIHIIDAVLLP
ncbi:MAG TPA: fasciclin domain-containing protein [Longimicrobiales bacterium]|nr:fasciclin domain-containing protein [Longimicrobiales bacterium]